jgi:hypothetical protein
MKNTKFMIEPLRRLVAGLRRQGFVATDIGEDWSNADFVDATHLSEAGGEKLAGAIAPLINVLARERSYEP